MPGNGSDKGRSSDFRDGTRPMKLLLKNLLFTILVPGSVAGWIPWILVRESGSPPARRLLLAAPAFAIGIGIYAWTVVNFAVIGRGTPAPIDAPRRLVIEGPHRCVRNPMYLGVLAVVLGWVLAFQSLVLLAYLALVALAFHAAVLFVEEPALRRQFGAEYLAYCRAVRRWIPGALDGRCLAGRCPVRSDDAASACRRRE